MIRKTQLLVLIQLVAVLLIWPTQGATATIPEAKPDKGLVGALRNGTVLHRYLEPGQHQFWSEVISQDSIMINVEPGKVYFVRGETTMGVMVARPKFTQVDDATGRAAVGNL